MSRKPRGGVIRLDVTLHQTTKEKLCYKATLANCQNSCLATNYAYQIPILRDDTSHERTVTILSRLDGTRKRSLLLFLYESKLVNTEGVASIVQLKGADLNRVDLHKANLRGVDLSGADLSTAIVTKEQMEKVKHM